jgi:hypothetical protein
VYRFTTLWVSLSARKLGTPQDVKFRVDDAPCGFNAAVRLFGFDKAFGDSVTPQLYLVQGNPQFGCCAFLEKS